MQKSLGILLIIISYYNAAAILTKMACRASSSGTCADPFCYVTPINEKINAANFGCGNLTRPLHTIKLKQEFYFKFYQNYIPFNIFPDVDYCSFAVNSNQLSYFSSIVNVLKQKVPGFVHPCPYVGKDFQIRNLTVVTSDLALWITGEYKLVYTVYDDKDPKIYQVSARGVIGKRT